MRERRRVSRRLTNRAVCGWTGGGWKNEAWADLLSERNSSMERPVARLIHEAGGRFVDPAILNEVEVCLNAM